MAKANQFFLNLVSQDLKLTDEEKKALGKLAELYHGHDNAEFNQAFSAADGRIQEAMTAYMTYSLGGGGPEM